MVEEVAVLVQGAGQDAEVDLAVLLYRYNPDHSVSATHFNKYLDLQAAVNERPESVAAIWPQGGPHPIITPLRSSSQDSNGSPARTSPLS